MIYILNDLVAAREQLNIARKKDEELNKNGLDRCVFYDLERTLLEKAKPAEISDLIVGGSYGIFDISPFANAWRGGKLKTAHGEVYLITYIYGDDGKLHNINAWGCDSMRNVKDDLLLIKL